MNNYNTRYDYRENEHQELFYEKANLGQPFEVNIPSPLVQLDYSFYVLVKNEELALLESITDLKIDLDGLREDHEILPLESREKGNAIIPSSIAGYSWRLLCTFPLSRGNGPLQITGFPKELTSVTLLITTWKRFVESGEAGRYLIAKRDPKWGANGMPLGGIGGGRIEICRDGRFRNFSMNNNQDAPIKDVMGVDGMYLSAILNDKRYDLATTPINEGASATDDLAFTPDFPRAYLNSEKLGINVTLQGTFTPHDLKTSSIPAFLLKCSVTNKSNETLNAELKLGWSNLIGLSGGVAERESNIGYGDGFYHFFNDPAGKKETESENKRYHGVSFTGTPDNLLGKGEHIIAVKKDVDIKTSANIDAIRHHAEIVAKITLAAGETKEVSMLVVTAMPNFVDTYMVNRHQYWLNNFNNAAEMAAHLCDNFDTIMKKGNGLSELLAKTTLPAWLKRRLTNCNYPLVTSSLFYKDGRFSINEGPTEMGGCMGTIDQRLGSHPTTQSFFPSLNAQELTQWADIQSDIGGIQHDLGAGHLEQKKGESTWPDLTCSFIIQTAKHANLMGDTDFSAKMYPHAKKALQRHGIWADEGHGVAQVGEGLGTSYDGYHYIGTTGYMATLWLAALKIMSVWSKKMGDSSLDADIERWTKLAKERLMADLWNGKHFISYAKDGGVRKESCHGGQMAGQYFAHLLTDENILDEKILNSTADSLLEYNCNDNFMVPPDEVDPETMEAAASFSWLPYIEAFMLTNLANLKRAEILPVWEKMMEVVDRDGVGSNDTRLMYRPHKGEPSWGATYMTSPASWLVYDSFLGFAYFKEAGELKLDPMNFIEGDNSYAIIHPLFWAIATKNDNKLNIEVTKVFGNNLTVNSVNGNLLVQPIELKENTSFDIVR